MTLRIDRCVCTRTTFAALVERARCEGLDLPELAAVTGASAQCGLCRPYLRRALTDGTVVFRELLPVEPPARHP